MTEPRLDPRRIEQLQMYADGGLTSIDPMAIATAAMATRRRWMPTWTGRTAMVLLLGLLLVAALAAAVTVGSRPSERPAALFTSLGHPRIDSGHAAVRLRDGRVLIVGSLARRSGRRVTSAIRRHGSGPGDRQPSHGRATQARRASCRSRRCFADGRVLVAGGLGRNTGEFALASAEIYDPATGRFSPTAPMTVKRGWDHDRQAHGVHPYAVALEDGRVFIIGGWPEPDSAEVFDPDTATFRPVGAVPGCGYGYILPVRLMDGRVVIRCEEGDWSYDPVDDSFRPTGTPGSASTRATQSVNLGSGDLLPDGRVLFTGAVGPSSGVWGDGPAELYDPVEGTFSALADGTNPPGERVSVTLRDGRVLLGLEDGRRAPVRPADRVLRDPAGTPGRHLAAGLRHPPR